MSVTNKIRVEWEFDIATDERLQEILDISAVKVEEMLNDEDEKEKLHRMCCSATGTPRYVDLDLFFEDPHTVSDVQITDALSDEYGWLINEWHYVQERYNPEDD